MAQKMLSTQAYKGTRDFYPEQMRVQQWMFSQMRQVAEKFGYQEYDGPLLESFDLYAAKTGEEIVSQQLYWFMDRGERKVAIRPEMTPTLARMVAAKLKELPRPIRLFSIPNLWRYERPQKGRLREHWQFNIDVLGGDRVLAGSMPILVSGSRKLSNSSFMINPQGKIVKRYDKIHLFDVSLKNDRSYHESKTFLAGTRISLAKTPWASVGMSICYDIRFAELYRKLSQQGSKLLMVPSSFTKPTGKAHWDCLTRVRAIENQCFLVAPAQTGSPYPGRLTYGHSRIVDPWGRVLCEKKTGTGFIIADLDFMELQKIRNEFPALKNRRLKV